MTQRSEHACSAAERPEYAPFQPSGGGEQCAQVRIAPLAASDVTDCAALAAERERGSLDEWLAAFGRRAEQSPVTTFVAHHGARLAGYGALGRLEVSCPAAALDGSAVWCFTGVVVAPTYRRRGVALALTRHRLDWLRGRATSVYSFANAANLASIALHERAGFREVSREFTVPGVSFAGGVGVLFRAEIQTA
ncbi:MAG: GNAT family N-acetyltransferase [Arachnia sp.]